MALLAQMALFPKKLASRCLAWLLCSGLAGITGLGISSAIAATKGSINHPTVSVFKVSPSQCVVMSQGQSCQADVKVSWATKLADDVCLYIAGENQPIHCWHNQRQGRVSIELSFDQTVTFELVSPLVSKPDNRLASANVELAWVHQKRGQLRSWSGWRLF